MPNRNQTPRLREQERAREGRHHARRRTDPAKEGRVKPVAGSLRASRRLPASARAAAGTGHLRRGELFSAKSSERSDVRSTQSCEQSRGTARTRKKTKDKKRHERAWGRQKDSRTKTNRRRRDSRAASRTSPISHACPTWESAGKKTGKTVPPAGTGQHFQSKPQATLAFPTSRRLKRRSEIPARTSFCSSIPNTFRSSETARNGRIGKPDFLLPKNATRRFTCTTRRTTAFSVGRIPHKAGRQPPPQEVP